MNLANPWAFYFLAVAVPIVALYLLRIRRRRRVVPSLALWQRVIKESRATALFQKLKRLLSLLLQILIMLLLVFALSRPFTGKGFLEEKNIVLILDASASMTVLEDDQRSRFETAVESSKRIIRDRGVADEMMIIRASTPPQVLQPFTRNTKSLLKSLESAKAGSEPASLAEAVKLAREVLGDRPGKKIMIVSDGSAGVAGSGGSAAELAKADDVEYISIGARTENVGIVTFRARKNMSVMTDFVFARVKNFGMEDADFRLELYANSIPKQVIPMSLTPGEERTHHFTPLAYPGGALLTLRIAGEGGSGPQGGGNWSDAFGYDDAAYAVIPPYEKKKVILVTPPEEDFFFTQAFSAMPETIDAEKSFAASESRYAELSDGEKQADVTIFFGCLPAHPARGNFVVIDSASALLSIEITGSDENVPVKDWNRKHRVTRFLSFHNLEFKKAQRIRLTAEGEILLDGPRGPLAVAANRKGKRVVHIGFDILDTDLPFRVAFPAILRNILSHFHEEEHAFFPPHYTVGESIRPIRRLPEDAREVVVDVLRNEGEERRVIGVDERTFLFNETSKPGFYKISFLGKSYFTVVNLLTAESDIKPVPSDTRLAALSKSTIFLNRDFWMLFALIGALVLATEWLLFHKRVTE